MAKITVKARLLNNALFEARLDETSGKTQFSSLAVLEPGEKEKIEKLRDEVCNAYFEGKVPPKLADWTVREGDDPDFANTYEKFFINAKSIRKPPVVVKENGVTRPLDKEEGLIYSGVYVYLSIDLYAYMGDKVKKNPPGITCGLRAAMFWKHGEPLGDVVNATNEFGDFDSELDEVEI